MTSQESQKKSTRRRYSPEFKIEALGLEEQAIENAKFKLQLTKQTSEVLIHEKMQTHSASPPSVRSLVYHVAGTIADVVGWKSPIVAKIASAARSPGSGCLCHPQGP